ncbi:MAG: DUF1579 domain-containing protein [bacterium]
MAAAVAVGPTIVSASAVPPVGLRAMPRAARLSGDVHDFDFLVGRWTVHHRRLKTRLAGSTEWEEFGGTLVNWPTLGGNGNVGDNVMAMPGGTLRGLGMRAFDSTAGVWSVWWLNASSLKIDPPMHGGFKDGVGTFLGDDMLNGKPVTVRVLWSRITPTSARWEQAFSPDGGKTWEINWISDFTRTTT